VRGDASVARSSFLAAQMLRMKFTDIEARAPAISIARRVLPMILTKHHLRLSMGYFGTPTMGIE
jgi:hypothetical protein